MEALLGKVDARGALDHRGQAAVVAGGRRLALAVRALLGEEALVGLLEVGLPGVGVELLVVLELLEVFQLGFLVDLLGLRLGAVLYVLKLLVQAHGRPPSRKAPSLGRRRVSS